MEISKPLQENILSVQSQLKNAIRDHQICVLRLKDDPQNTDIMDRMREIQLHIVSLGRWQKSVIQQLRNEVQSHKSENPVNGARVTLSSLLGLSHNNNNNHDPRLSEVAVVANIQQRLQQQRLVNGHADKEDYEDVVRNGSSPIGDDCFKKELPEEEVVELPVDGIRHYIENKIPVAREQQCFLSCLGLITNAQHTKLQKKRLERKRRSNAGSTPVLYEDWEVPTKRKKHGYLQGNAPQTRQTTARLNGTSSPPAKAAMSSRSSNSSSCSSKSNKASFAQKPKTVAIMPKLRNGTTDTKVQKDSLVKRSTRFDRVTREMPVGVQQTVSTVHTLPRLPSGLTIERIENDSPICVACRNPGSLLICEYCSAKFHVSCHTVSPASSNYCPTCASRFRSDVLSTANLESLRHEITLKKEKEAAAAAALYSRRALAKAGEDSEFDNSTSGLHKTDAGQSRQQQLLTLGIKQLPSSTFLIPISAASPATTAAGRDAVDESIVVPGTSSSHIFASSTLSRLGYSSIDKQQQQQQSILLNQLSQPSLESRLLHHSYGEIVSAGQSVLVIDPMPPEKSTDKRRWGKKKSASKPKQAVSVLNYDWASRVKSSGSQQSELTISKIGRPKSGNGGNYVTVRVTCDDDDYSRKSPSENSNDCVYVSENSHSSGVPDVIDLESPPRSEERKSKDDGEVHNVSSGSSCTQQNESFQSSDPQTTARHSESSPNSDGNRNDTSASNNFLGSIFPGKYGFKLDIIEVGSSAGRSSSLSSSADSMPSSPKQHMKLEETNLSEAPPREEQLATEISEDNDKKENVEVLKAETKTD